MTTPKLLNKDEIATKSLEIDNWDVIEEHHLLGVFEFPDFASAMDFTIQVGRVAEQLQHHPEITLGVGKVFVEIYTHDVGGLSDLDFQFASEINKLKK